MGEPKRDSWNLTIRGKNKAAVITTIDKEMLPDFKKASQILHKRKKITAFTPYAAASYLLQLGIRATLAAAEE